MQHMYHISNIDDALESDSSTPRAKKSDRSRTPPSKQKESRPERSQSPASKQKGSRSNRSVSREVSSTSDQKPDVDLLDLLSGEPIPQHSVPGNANAGISTSDNTKAQHDLAAVFGAGQPSVIPTYANHQQGGMANYTQLQQYYPVSADSAMHVQERTVNGLLVLEFSSP